MKAKNKPKTRKERRALKGVAALGVAGLAVPKAAELTTGRTKLYHGTAQGNVESIKRTGVQPMNRGHDGVSKVLHPSIQGESHKLSFYTTKKSVARNIGRQADAIKGKKTLEDTIKALHRHQSDDKNFWRNRNPLNNRNIVTAKVPLWKENIAAKIRPNPEAMGNFKNWANAMDPYGFRRRKLSNRFEMHMVYDVLSKKTKAIEGTLSTKYIKGSPNYQRVNLKEIGQYMKARPGKFAAGVALSAGALGAGAYGLKKLNEARLNRKALRKAARSKKKAGK